MICQSSMVHTCLHSAERSDQSTPVWVHHGCAGALSPAGQVNDVALMRCNMGERWD